MMLGALNDAEMYSCENKLLKKGFDFLKNCNFQNVEDGRYEIEGMDVFAIIMSYTTRNEEEVICEAHKSYIDIQYIISGEEYCMWLPLHRATSVGEIPEKDIYYYEGETHKFPLSKGDFAVFFPNDVHGPNVKQKENIQVRKAVVKIRMKTEARQGKCGVEGK